MNNYSRRRKFLKNMLALPAVASAGMVLNAQTEYAGKGLAGNGSHRLKT